MSLLFPVGRSAPAVGLLLDANAPVSINHVIGGIWQEPAARCAVCPLWTLLEGVVVMDTRQSGRLSLVKGGNRDAGDAGVDALLASAAREVLVLCSGGGVGPIGAFSRIDRANLRRGVRYRVLFPDSARLSGRLTGLSLAGAEVRTETEVPMDAVVVDGTTALLPAVRDGVALFRLPSVVAATTALFERIWPAAVPLTPAEPSDDEHASPLSRRERDLLALLCSGSTDESAAARLGISVRTVRRTVADIMNRLGARSRFQAGVKAADRGWLMDRAS
ncbi:helix-turn-helix transcriptional regulator [Actinosynnema sp. CS-041913]|uniref:helix-turn-helix transcriptional regulator n=1 Tax=Actinosynnema sp. CS-041913 TaxID=3239917 RepID=UPI003D8A22F4